MQAPAPNLDKMCGHLLGPTWSHEILVKIDFAVKPSNKVFAGLGEISSAFF